MGASTSKPEQHRKYEQRYALDNAVGVRLLLREWHALEQRRYAGDTAASDILIDLLTAIEKAGLTERQRQAIHLTYVMDMKMTETGKRMGVRKDTVSRHVQIAATKIARVYEYWARRGEGYSLGEGETE